MVVDQWPGTPETMTAEARRRCWYEDEPKFIVSYLRGFAHEFTPLANSTLDTAERIFGKSKAAICFKEFIPGSEPEDENWHGPVSRTTPSQILKTWPGAQFIDQVGLYGLFGVTAADWPLAEKRYWVASLTVELEHWQDDLKSDRYDAIRTIVDLALSRHALEHEFYFDGDENKTTAEVDVRSLSIFGGVTEGRIRNILSDGSGGLVRIGHKITATSAKAWLKGRKEFFASIWDQPEGDLPAPPNPDFSGEVIFVPVAADGSTFHPGLARNGSYTIGAKGEEERIFNFDDALIALQKMATPRWRRPNDAGNWGIVSGRDWRRVERY
ncbi:hypothetical protein [Ruegeria sp. Ofav3-42]|uniref:hypothetical protein n=1 Tax=Ruegeria sp. Ofav3-42 TaxID=2917759 RepID=UPI001EF72127|nr:hypothetical protein [Ruegeria sp. Ofav3-42]MCG7521038.1 hypothetical protein [Ruegeria sp. Ofav3-42]